MKSKWRGITYKLKYIFIDPGYCNFQFSKFDALKGKFLN